MNEYREILLSGCGDHGCYFVKPQGIGTNGGCSCLARITGSRSQIQSIKTLVELLAKQEDELIYLHAGEDI